MSEEFKIKDSGKRAEFSSGMVRDTSEGKIRYHRVFEGPMFKRWAQHLMKGAIKYPDVRPGVANWTLADGPEERQRFKESALTHFVQWFLEERDEDHAAGVFFNINGAEYVREKLSGRDTASRSGNPFAQWANYVNGLGPTDTNKQKVSEQEASREIIPNAGCSCRVCESYWASQQEKVSTSKSPSEVGFDRRGTK